MSRFKKGAVGFVDLYGAQDALLRSREQALHAVIRCRRAVMEREMIGGTALRDQGLQRPEDGGVVRNEAARSR